MNASRQKLGIARTMRRVTVHTILADRRMVPKKRTPFFGMAGVTQIIDGMIQEHLPPLPAMRIVAGSAADLHVAKLGAEQMGGALEQSLSLINVAIETRFLYGEVRQHPLGQPSVYDLRDFALRPAGETGRYPVEELFVMDAVAR